MGHALACRCPLAGAFFHGFSIPITDRIGRAAPAGRSGTNRPAARTHDSECALQSRRPHLAAGAELRPRERLILSILRRVAEEYECKRLNAPGARHHEFRRPCCRAHSRAGQRKLSPGMSSLARAQIGTPFRSGHASRQTSPPDDIVRNAHRKRRSRVAAGEETSNKKTRPQAGVGRFKPAPLTRPSCGS